MQLTRCDSAGFMDKPVNRWFPSNRTGSSIFFFKTHLALRQLFHMQGMKKKEKLRGGSKEEVLIELKKEEERDDNSSSGSNNV